MTRGRLITIEGIDGAGKSTLAIALAARLREHGVAPELLREPGGVEAAERVRALVADPALRIGARAEALLYAAARAQLVEERLEPLLAAGRWVLLDRFIDSSLAYQGAGRGLGVAAIAELNRFATASMRADRTLLLRIDPALGRSRQACRGGPVDRLEGAGENFFQAVAAAYDELARAEPERIRVLDAELDPAALLDSAVAALVDLLAP
ncbi:MAG: dTMP kinase [Solirubrobacterales bacterium]|nr:MAG: dTMP kinase [Solirubrobacterales bacterium]